MPNSMTPAEFIAKYQQAELKERSFYQSHFNDLCALLGLPGPVEADPTGAWFTFEAGAAKSTGGEGFADVWRKGYFAWEYKGLHKDLDAAYRQLLAYHDALDNPPLLIVSDSAQIIIHTKFTNAPSTVLKLTLGDLATPQGLDALRAAFTAPDRLRPTRAPDSVTEEAAGHFAELARILRAYGEPAEVVAKFLIRLLFCLFAEDIELLPDRVFTRLVRQFQAKPKVFAQQAQALFEAMRSGGYFGVHEIPYVDGSLFLDTEALELDADGMKALAQACALDWSQIEPSILGALFERGLDPDKRSQLGAHYTSRDDIARVVEPVLMAPLRREWGAIQEELGIGQAPLSPRQRKAAEERLRAFARRLASIRVLDPACGSGNFLYVALRALLDLWEEVSTAAFRLGLTKPMPLEDEAPHPKQLGGIEVNPYAHALAQATVWIGHLQWLRERGYGIPKEPTLKPLHTIQLMDAVLAYDDQGAPVEPGWPAAEVIIGNPPFLGGNKVRQELGDQYVEDLFALYKDRVPAFADLVCYWFEKARAQIERGQAGRVGLLATQAIRGGANRKVLERIKASGDIFWAQADRDWVLDGANVHVSMVGFDAGAEKERELDGQPVSAINADLTSVVDLTKTQRLRENANLCFMGPSPKAPFDIDANLAAQMLAAPLNPNGRPNSDVVRPVASAVDLVQRSRNLWTIDFNLMVEENAALYEMPFEYVKRHILPVREGRRDDYRGQWWQYARPRPEMRRAIEGLPRFIATPAVAKHRIFVWMPSEVLCNQGTLVIARDDDYFMGVLHARPHAVWALRLGTQLEDRPRYTPTTTFETYPFPWPPGQEPWADERLEAIARAARELLRKREAWLHPGPPPSPCPLPEGEGSGSLPPRGRAGGEGNARTLTALYNARPTWLALAHAALDRAVCAAYGWPEDPVALTDDDILARLLALNRQRA